MKLDILYLLFIGYFAHAAVAAGKDNDVHAKINEPELVQKETIKRSPRAYGDKYERNNGENERIIVHNHGDRFIYDPDHAHANKKNHENNQNNRYENGYDGDEFKEYLQNFKAKPSNENDVYSSPTYYDDGFKTSKSVRTEHFEVKETNPKARTPDEKYIIRGGYKVQETDPFDSSKKTQHLHTYDSPISKIAASIYSKFDYLNFPNNKDDYFDNEEKEKEKEESLNHENIEYYSQPEKDKPDHEKAKLNDEDHSYGGKYFDYFSSPSQESVEMRYPEYDYDREWKKHILEHIYGEHNSPAASEFVQILSPKRKT